MLRLYLSTLMDARPQLWCNATNCVHRHKIVKSRYKCISRNFTDQLWYDAIKSAVRSPIFWHLAMLLRVCGPIVWEWCRVPNTQWQLHLIVLSSIVCYWVWSRVHQCSPVCYWVCADRPIVSAELWEGCHRAGHTHTVAVLSPPPTSQLSLSNKRFSDQK